MKAWIVSALFGLLVQSAKSQLTPWDNQLFIFGWEPYDATIVRCSTIQVSWNDRATANPASTPPYTISIIQGNSQPLVVAIEASHAYPWTVALPVGGPYILTIDDSRGYTGGTSLVFNVQDPAAGVTCGASSAASSNSLQVTTTGSYAQCSTLVVTTQGGTAPYKMQILAGERPPKTTTWTTPSMSYTIDLKSSEQFFVKVTDANGLVGVEGIHTVTNGDTACYNLATTVIQGALPTTLSYDPSSTVSIPGGSSSSSSSSRSVSRVIQNTATTTIVSTIILDDGSSSTYTLAPGSSATIANSNSSGTEPSPNNLPAIIGGAVGGAALLIILLIILLWHRRRSAQQAFERQQNGKAPFSPVGPQPMLFEGSHISPFTPPFTPGRDTAPLMAHMNSVYSNGSGGSGPTPAPSTPGMSYFGNNNNYAGGPGHVAAASPESPPVWAVPVRQGSLDATNYTTSSGSAPTPLVGRSTSVWSGEGIPPGAMAPKAPSWGGGPIEKATFVPSRPPGTVAPPPYSQGG